MARGQISILSGEEIASVHEHTLALLKDPGVRVHSEAALKVLERGGATVDMGRMRASLPVEMVDEVLSKVPKTVRLGGRIPERDMVAPRPGPPFMAINGTAVYVTDLQTGEKRQSVGKDLKDFMILADALDSVDYVWPIVTAHDGPERGRGLNDLVIALKNTTKHMQGEAMSAEEARAEIRAGAAVVGSEEELAKRPVFSVIQCPICPMSFEKGSVEAVMEFALAGIPVVSMSMALCGLTSPVTLASTIAIVNAENIASFAISQMTKPGAPVVYSSESTVMNMVTGEIRYGSLEEVLIAAAVGQMARHYRIPSMVGSFGAGLRSDSPGINVDPAELIFSAMTNLSLTDFSSGLGGLDQAKGSSLEQLVIDADIWESIRELRKEVSFDEEHYALDVIRATGPGGNFLSAPHTLRNMRKELFLPSLEKARMFDAYRLDREPAEIVRTAKQRVMDMLESHTPEPLDSGTANDLDTIVEEFSKR